MSIKIIQKKIGGTTRYYKDKYVHGNKEYALTSQLYTTSITPFLDLATSKGLTNEDVANLCVGKEEVAREFIKNIMSGK